MAISLSKKISSRRVSVWVSECKRACVCERVSQ